MSIRRIIIISILATAAITTSLMASDHRNVPDDATAIRPILVGQTLPSIELKAPDGSSFDLNAAVASKPTILIFFRGGWCPYCNTHLGALQSVEPKLVELGYQVIAVSADRPEIIEIPVEKNGLTYAVYSDQDMTAAQALGIAFRLDDATVEKYKGYGIDLEKDSGRTHHILPVPAAFVIDTKGVIRYSYVNPDYKVRIDPEVLFAEAKAALKQ
jgi:peroxiredoxin